MKSLSLTLLALLCLTAGTACLNAAGERMSLWQWFRSRDQGGQEDESPPGRSDRLATTAPADRDGPQTEAPESASDPVVADYTTPHTSAATDRRPDRDGTTALTSTPDGAAAAGAAANRPAPSSRAIHSSALVVNDETISVNDVLEPLLPTIEKLARRHPPGTYYQRVSELIQQQIKDLVAQHLFWRRAAGTLDENLEPQLEKTVDKMEKDRINREFNGSETRYAKYLAKQGKSRDEVRQRLRRSIIIDGYLREQILKLVPAPRKQELLQYYNTHQEEFSKQARREMVLIDVPIAAFLDPSKPRTRARWDQAAARARTAVEDAAEALKAGETFEDVVGKYSHGVNKAKGGAWGFIREPLRGRWAEPSKRAFELKPSETSEIIESADSFFIVKVGKVEGGEVVSFQDAQPQIANMLRQARFNRLRGEFLQAEWEKSTIGPLDTFVTEVLNTVPPPQ